MMPSVIVASAVSPLDVLADFEIEQEAGPNFSKMSFGLLLLALREWSYLVRTFAQQFLAAVVLSAIAYSNACAADIQETNNKLCAFRLDGIISKGDFDKTFQLINRNLSRIDKLDERTRTVCLKSVGGLYVEAVKI